MGKALALAAVTFIALGTYYNGVRSSSELDTRRRVSNSQYEAISRGAALAGISVAKQSVAEKSKGWKISNLRGDHQGGSYAVSVKPNGPKRAVLESTGTIRNAGRMSENYTIRILMERRHQLPENPPTWAQYAIATDSDIEFKGNVDVTITNDAAYDANANVHTNGNLSVSGNSVDIGGFGSYSGTANGNHVDNTFDPNYNPTNAPTHYSADAVPIPSFGDVDYLSATDAYGQPLVDHSTTGVTELSGSYDFGGTREDPYIWYIDGDLSVTNNTTIDGYVLFVVDGNVELKGDLVVGDSGYSGETESSIGVTTSGNFSLAGSQTLEAQVYAAGNISTAKGTPTLRGSLTAKGIVELKGTPNIYYKPASSSLTQFWQNDFKFTYHILGYHEQ